MLKTYLKIVGRVFIYFFALVGLVLTTGFLAVKYHLTDTLGQVDFNDRYFAKVDKLNEIVTESFDQTTVNNYLCRARAIKKIYPDNGAKILLVYQRTGSLKNTAKMVEAAELYLQANSDYQAMLTTCSNPLTAWKAFPDQNNTANLYPWIESEEWQTLKQAVAKDKDLINQVAQKTGVPSRLLVAQIVGEQLRLFHDDREVFKQVFQPLKILGNEVQFSLGVAGIKEETAKKIEENLTDKTSSFYLGSSDEHLLDFQTANHDQERFSRLTDAHDRTYSYLYTALFLKQVETQWQKAGFDISNRPEILATLFNLGFDKSIPKVDPQVGGSVVTIDDRDYTFGGLAYDFYYSGELLDEFPYQK